MTYAVGLLRGCGVDVPALPVTENKPNDHKGDDVDDVSGLVPPIPHRIRLQMMHANRDKPDCSPGQVHCGHSEPEAGRRRVGGIQHSAPEATEPD